MKFLRIIYTAHAFLIFCLGFLFLMPFFMILIQVKSWHKYAVVLNNAWARYMFLLMFMPVKVEYRQKLNRRQRYVFCPNHFSYLDIPLCGLVKNRFVFVGKSSMGKIPVFGYMYRKIHITVDRESLKSKYNTLVRAKEAIDNGKSVILFPEGGIRSENPPHMASFKEGAFRMAIEKQIPVVPITIPFNWIILPVDENLFRWKKCRLIIHEPIPTTGLTLENTDELKEKVFKVIEGELIRHFPEEFEKVGV